MRVSVGGKNARTRRLSDLAAGESVGAFENLDDCIAALSEEDLAVRLKKRANPLPGVADNASPRSSRFENSSGRGEAITGHALAVDVERRRTRAKEGVMIILSDMAD